MLIAQHIIQSFPPSNLNRDEAGNPKDCIFGGSRRLRVSSQSWKRAIRIHPVFADTTGVAISYRTRWLAWKLTRRLVRDGRPAEAVDDVVYPFVDHLLKLDADGKRSAVLLFTGLDEIDSIHRALVDDWDALASEATRADTIETIVKAIARKHAGWTAAPDVALFGRMLAVKTATQHLQMDAACSVAHAISTHRVGIDSDFFTAVDDLQTNEDGLTETGAGMIGYSPFASATFYRYANVQWEQLLLNLKGDVSLARRSVEAFLRASEAAIPSGKRHSTAPYTRPAFISTVVRDGQTAWSMVNAFESAVPSGRNGLIVPSVERFEQAWEYTKRAYGDHDLVSVTALPAHFGLTLTKLQDVQAQTLDEQISAVLNALPE